MMIIARNPEVGDAVGRDDGNEVGLVEGCEDGFVGCEVGLHDG